MGFYLIRTGEIEVNLVTREFRLTYVPDLAARKLAGTEDLAGGHLREAEVSFHEGAHERLRVELPVPK